VKFAREKSETVKILVFPWIFAAYRRKKIAQLILSLKLL